MKRFLLVLILTNFLHTIYGLDVTVTNNEVILAGTEITWDYNVVDIKSNVSVTVEGTGKLTVNGNFTDGGPLIVESGATLIINGDLDLSNNNSTLNGDVIVTGNVTLKNTDMIGSANLIVGGTLSSGGGNLNDVTGDVYLLDPDANPNPPDLGTGNEPKTVEDLITDESSSLIDNVTDSSGSSTCNWDGSESAVWSTVGNWVGDKAPGALDAVVIESGGNTPVLSGTKSINNLTVKTGATLSVQAGSRITVFGNITIESGGTINIANTDVSPTSFLVLGTSSGTGYEFDWSYETLRWWYLGIPVPSFDVTNFGDLEGTDKTAIIYTYATSWNGPLTSHTLSSMEGYGLVLKNSGTITYNGAINDNESYAKSLVDGWQMIANPYPAYYNLVGADADFTNTTGSIYGYTGASASRSTYTYNIASNISTPAGCEVLAPCQGFWVQKSTDGDVTMRKSRLIQDASGGALKSIKLNDQLIRLKLKNDKGSDEAVIAFRDNGAKTYSKLDSEKRINTGNETSIIYSIKDDVRTVINVLPQLSETYAVKLGVTPVAGTHTLVIDGSSSLNSEVDLVLEDTKTGELTLMTEGSEYAYDATADDLEARFVLHLKKAAISTGLNDSKKESNLHIQVLNKSALKIKCNWIDNTKNVDIFDITGRLLHHDTFTGIEYFRMLPLKAGIYIVKVSGETEIFEKKVIIK